MLTESHYIALQSASGAPPNRDLAELLAGEGAVLIVGMSLADPNLRRLLYLRALSPFVIAPTYAVLKKSGHQRTDELHQTYWRLRKTTILSIDKHESLLPELRQIQHGVPIPSDPPPWLRLAALAVAPHDVFNNDWQREAWVQLRELRDRLVGRDRASNGEIVELSLFRVMADVVEIRQVASTRPARARTQQEAIQHAEKRRLSVRVGDEQGIAGAILRERFEARVAHAGKPQREFHTGDDGSVGNRFRIPRGSAHPCRGISDGERYWVPVGVVVATSSLATTGPSSPTSDVLGPCWRRHPASLRELREIGERLLLRKS